MEENNSASYRTIIGPIIDCDFGHSEAHSCMKQFLFFCQPMKQSSGSDMLLGS